MLSPYDIVVDVKTTLVACYNRCLAGVICQVADGIATCYNSCLAGRFKEHQKAPSSIFDHFNTTCHTITIDKFSIVGREDQNLNRAIKEALFIRFKNSSLNRNIGKFHLPHIWDEVLFNTS